MVIRSFLSSRQWRLRKRPKLDVASESVAALSLVSEEQRVAPLLTPVL